MENSIVIFKEQFKQVKVLYNAVLYGIGVIIVFAVLFSYFQGPLKGFNESSTISLELFLLIYAVGAIYIGDLLFVRRIKALTARNSLQTKMLIYRSAFTLKLGIFESIAALGGILLILSGIYLVLLIPVALIAIILRSKPTASKVLSELPLSSTEREQLASLL